MKFTEEQIREMINRHYEYQFNSLAPMMEKWGIYDFSQFPSHKDREVLENSIIENLFKENDITELYGDYELIRNHPTFIKLYNDVYNVWYNKVKKLQTK